MTHLTRHPLRFALPLLLLAVLWLGRAALAAPAAPGAAHLGGASHPGRLNPEMRAFLADRQPAQALQASSSTPITAFTPCVGGMADIYPCNNVDLWAFLPLSMIGGGNGADLWGWTDAASSREFVLFGRSNGTAFVEITDPENPIYLGNLPSHTGTSSWRDVETDGNYAFIVADLNGSHGVQVFDLTQLLSVPTPPVTFAETDHYAGVGSVHTIAVNQATDFAYAVGSSMCSGGLHMIDISDPLNLAFAGCFSADGYTHETQCVLYSGPDPDHVGDEICFASNEDTLTIVDVTNKAAPVMLSRTTYAGSAYTHQGWLSRNGRFFALDDELDESFFGHNTRTRYFDVSDLEAPVLAMSYTASTPAIDHNQYFKGNLVFQANYRAGLRIVKAPSTELGFFDIYPANDNASFNGAWGNYPFFASGVIAISGIEQGLFLVQANPALLAAAAADPGAAAWLGN